MVTKRLSRIGIKLAIVILVIVSAVALFLRYGGRWLVATNPLPAHAQVAIALQGSITGFVARRTEVMRLLERGVVDYAMVSMPPASYWGENIPQVAQHYFSQTYGPRIAQRVVYCVSDADSTMQEAVALKDCLEEHGWRQVIVVTSVYHTRRTGMIWRSTLDKADPHFQLWIRGVVDADFHPRRWWRNRRYAKTWFFETYKLVWEYVFGSGPWRGVPVKAELVLPSSARQALAGDSGH
jgi:hypothetical protein